MISELLWLWYGRGVVKCGYCEVVFCSDSGDCGVLLEATVLCVCADVRAVV